MSGTPRNPAVERVADRPFDKDAVSPVPQYAPRAHSPGEGAEGASDAPLPSSPAKPHDREEYPGPQTSSTGERVEPGRGPSGEASGERSDVNEQVKRDQTEPEGRSRAKGASHGRA